MNFTSILYRDIEIESRRQGLKFVEEVNSCWVKISYDINNIS